MRNSGPIQKHNIKLSPQHFPVGTLFRKSTDPLGEGDPNYGKVLTCTGINYNGVGSFVIHHDGAEHIEGVRNGVNAYWVTEIIKRGDGPVVFDNKHSWDRIKAHIEDVLHFVYAPKDWRWDKVDTHVCLKTNYLFFTYHDIIYVMLAKYKKDPSEYVSYDKIESALRNDPNTTFIRTIGSGVDYDTFKGVAGYKANKKRLDRWFKQNINRFKKSVKRAKQEEVEMMDEVMAEYDCRDMEAECLHKDHELVKNEWSDGAGDTAYALAP